MWAEGRTVPELNRTLLCATVPNLLRIRSTRGSRTLSTWLMFPRSCTQRPLTPLVTVSNSVWKKNFFMKNKQTKFGGFFEWLWWVAGIPSGYWCVPSTPVRVSVSVCRPSHGPRCWNRRCAKNDGFRRCGLHFPWSGPDPDPTRTDCCPEGLYVLVEEERVWV